MNLLILNNESKKFKKSIIIKNEIEKSIIKKIIKIDDKISIIFSLIFVIYIIKMKINLLKR